MDEKRIKLAEAMGWQSTIDTDPTQPIGISPNEDGSQGTKIMPDPFTDANDDYAVLEWVRNVTNISFYGKPQWLRFNESMPDIVDYKIGDYARAACKVLEL